MSKQPQGKIPKGDYKLYDRKLDKWIAITDWWDFADNIVILGDDTEMTRGLFLCWVVDTETEDLVWFTNVDEAFVANDQESAHRKAIQLAGSKLEKDLDIYSFGLLRVVELPARKEIQKVQLISADS